MSDTDTLLARQLHEAALAVIDARNKGDVAGETQARARLKSLSDAYRSAGHTEDELEAAKAGGGLGGLLSGAARITKNLAVIGALGLALFIWLDYRKGHS